MSLLGQPSNGVFSYTFGNTWVVQKLVRTAIIMQWTRKYLLHVSKTKTTCSGINSVRLVDSWVRVLGGKLDSPESPALASESILSNTIQLVVTILKKFISEVVRGSLVSKFV